MVEGQLGGRHASDVHGTRIHDNKRIAYKFSVVYMYIGVGKVKT